MKYSFDLKTSGGRLKYIRIRKGITIKRLAELVNVSERQIIRYENNYSSISGYALEKIAKVLNVDMNYILVGKR